VGPAARGVGGRGRWFGPARGAPRGGRGVSNGNSPLAGSSVAARGGKRKAGADLQSGTSKRRNTDWGTQPIAQQPLKKDMKQDLKQELCGGAVSYDGNDGGQEWYQDSYGQQWK